MAITLFFLPCKSRALAIPKAKLIEVEVCPSLKKSCSLSSKLEYPVIEANASSFVKASCLPVNIL